MIAHAPADLERIYSARFDATRDYRDKVWQTLIDGFFQQFVQPGDRVLDLGCGYGEFIRNVECGEKLGMDLNPGARANLSSGISFLQQDCAETWPMSDGSLDVVFTSNFFEHLPDKAALGRTLDEIYRCLAPGGRLIAMGPNVRFLAGAYWDFWDHYIPLTERSLAEALTTRGFEMARVEDRFLPYSMVGKRKSPMFLIRAYLKLRPAWKLFGRQFLVVARKHG